MLPLLLGGHVAYDGYISAQAVFVSPGCGVDQAINLLPVLPAELHVVVFDRAVSLHVALEPMKVIQTGAKEPGGIRPNNLLALIAKQIEPSLGSRQRLVPQE
jgi:hypothetical protein